MITTTGTATETLLREALHQIGLEVIEERVYAPKKARYAPLPKSLHPGVHSNLAARFPKGLYSHQSEAIAMGLDGQNICICTPTASGKTVVFSSVVISTLKNRPGSKALALYPAKALIHDQQSKWQAATADMGLSACLIHGGIPISERISLLKDADIVLMTPDVLHAWVMSGLDKADIQAFLKALDIVVLDEAHVYDGVFGTNMAYLLRRLQAVSAVRQFLLSTATIGEPERFASSLTGTECAIIGTDQDGSATPEKKILVTRLGRNGIGSHLKKLIQALASAQGTGRFLVFADSRMRVEELATIANPAIHEHTGNEEADFDKKPLDIAQHKVLPYRAGYEQDDRLRIQESLADGNLAGVISTSALELGIDIGEIEVVINLGLPNEVRAFWQRAGRAGRQKEGIVLLVDERKQLDAFGGLDGYLSRGVEPAWLYLDNEYLQYANVLCAAEEQAHCSSDSYHPGSLASLPDNFQMLLENEVTPRRSVEPELYRLKQEAIGGAHRAFPLRTGIEKTYTVVCSNMPSQRLGTLTYAQVLREAYPGAIYRYMTYAFRVVGINHSKAEIRVKRAKPILSTDPIIQTKVFPQFAMEPFFLRQDVSNMVVETKLQVSERVIGFNEKIGGRRIECHYELGSSYSQRPLNRFIETTGVCFRFDEMPTQHESLAGYIAEAFSTLCGIHMRDIGYGSFFSAATPSDPKESRGFAIFDAASGSLRLTHRLVDCLDDVLEEAARLAMQTGASRIAEFINRMGVIIEAMPSANLGGHSDVLSVFMDKSDGDWICVVAAEQPAILCDGSAQDGDEVTVLRYLYTPQGLRYELQHSKKGVKWIVSASIVRPIYGATRMVRYNLMSGDEQDMSGALAA